MSNEIVLFQSATTLSLSGDYERDLEIGASIRAAVEQAQWVLGDWANAMEGKHGGTKLSIATDMSKVTGVPAHTLRAYALVARTFPTDKRLAEASWSHHHVVCGAPDPDAVLRQSVEDGLSTRDAKRLAKGLPVGGEDVAQKESSITASGASMEEAVLASIVLAEEHLTRAFATMSKAGFRCTVNVGQDIMAKLEAASKPFIAIEAAVKSEVGALL